MSFKERLGEIQIRIDELTLRERGILFLVFIVVFFMIADTMLIAPQEKSQKKLLSEITAVRAEISLMEQQKLDIINRHNIDPNAAETARLQQLNDAGQVIEKKIKKTVNGLIEPEEMARALESVLKGQRELNFVRIQNLGAKSLLDVEQTEEQSPHAGIYKHTLRIELEGSFHQARNYLQALEQLPWRFHWQSVELEMIEYPVARIVITVNTLSLKEGWIGV